MQISIPLCAMSISFFASSRLVSTLRSTVFVSFSSDFKRSYNASFPILLSIYRLRKYTLLLSKKGLSINEVKSICLAALSNSAGNKSKDASNIETLCTKCWKHLAAIHCNTVSAYVLSTLHFSLAMKRLTPSKIAL